MKFLKHTTKTKVLLASTILVLSGLSSGLFAAGGKVTDPAGEAPDRYVYYPG